MLCKRASASCLDETIADRVVRVVFESSTNFRFRTFFDLRTRPAAMAGASLHTASIVEINTASFSSFCELYVAAEIPPNLIITSNMVCA